MTAMNQEREEAIAWLDSHNLPVIPVAPTSIPEISNTKNPSYLDRFYIGHRIEGWPKFADNFPSDDERKKWFENPENGIGTISGVNGIYWLDIDYGYFCNEAKCAKVAMELWEKVGRVGLLEKTQSGGWHIAFKSKQNLRTSPFCTDDFANPSGEILGQNTFVVLAPSKKNSYRTIVRSPELPEVTLENLGIEQVAAEMETEIEYDEYEECSCDCEY